MTRIEGPTVPQDSMEDRNGLRVLRLNLCDPLFVSENLCRGPATHLEYRVASASRWHLNMSTKV